MIHLVTYHSPNMSISAERCKQSALKHGVDKVWQWTRPALEQTEFFEQNKAILTEPRGDGLWCWKPFVLLDTLNKAKPGDFVFYSDAGVEFINSVQYIIDRMEDIWLFGNMYKHTHFCKADTFVPICSNDLYGYEGKQSQASVIVIRKTVTGIDFVVNWLKWCLIPGVIDDTPSKLPNVKEFVDHRHDQSVLTCLAIRERVALHWWPATYNNGAFNYPKEGYNDNYPVLFHHHRRRDTEWQ